MYKPNLNYFRVVRGAAPRIAWSDAPYVLEVWKDGRWQAVWGLDRDMSVEDALADFDYLEDLLEQNPELRA